MWGPCIQVIFNIALEKTSLYCCSFVHMAFQISSRCVQYISIKWNSVLLLPFFSLAQAMSSFHSKVQYTKITVSWIWKTLVKVTMPCSAAFFNLLVVGLTQGTGSSPMELGFPHQAYSGNSTVMTCFGMRFICTAGEEVWLESTTVRYLAQQMLSKPYILEYTQQTLVSGTKLSQFIWYIYHRLM